MGIRPYKAFTFDGKSSLDYGVYLTGEGVFNAPERAVEMLEIPGRNGNFVLDQGRFQNISVTYKAGMVDYSETDFATRVSNVRNWLCSKVGYKRLEDDYNPNEYRMAAFIAGIEVEHDDLQTGEFEITFDCKPQRWLTSGEIAVTVADGGTLDNPTLFEAEPLIVTQGYGTLQFNGYEINIENVPVGDVLLVKGKQYSRQSLTVKFNNSAYNPGDAIKLAKSEMSIHFESNVGEESADRVYTSLNYSNSNASFQTLFSSENHGDDFSKLVLFETISAQTFTAGTAQTVTNTATITGKQKGTNFTATAAYTITYTPSATPTEDQIEFNASYTYDSSKFTTMETGSITCGNVNVYSTISAIVNPINIDCEIGECWMVENDEIVSLNGIIDLGSDLPKLSVGANEFTYDDNTMTEVLVSPRWWKV